MGEVVTAQVTPEQTSETTPALSPEQQAQAAKEIPDFVPEKFHSAEDPIKAMAESYMALQQKLGDPDPKPEETSEDTQAGGEESQDGGEAEDEQDDDYANVSYGPAVDAALTAAELTPGDIAKEWNENGALSEETYSKLNTVGYTKEVVDAYVKGFQDSVSEQQVTNDAAVKGIKDSVGGEDEYAQMTEWAKQNLSTEEIASYNEAVSGSNVGLAKLAVDGLKSRFEASEGREPVHQEAGGSRSSRGVFANQTEFRAAMREARASKDPDRIRAVEKKAMRSPNL